MGSYARGGFYAERIFPWIMDRADTLELRGERQRTVSEACGRVLEIGVGTGANFRYYGANVSSVTAVEPSGGMNRRAAQNRKDARVPVSLVAGSAERLPFRDRVFDTVVAVFVLCTIPDAGKALAEARRVLAPSGRLLFLEHVRAPDPGVERWQRGIQPVWGRLACGCVLARNTERRIVEAGFSIEALDRFWLPRVPRIVGRLIRGRAAMG
ncbi:MAG TPA: class I SAM-dependent methyltransferase [Gemmatimonadota bacterium]|nr:class I SAM-dependent methyltransferase [Gemmatimonadota bacterium]